MMSNLPIHTIIGALDIADGIFSIIEYREWLFDQDKFLLEATLNIYTNMLYRFVKFKQYKLSLNAAVSRLSFVLGAISIVFKVDFLKVQHKSRFIKIGFRSPYKSIRIYVRTLKKKPSSYLKQLGFFDGGEHKYLKICILRIKTAH